MFKLLASILSGLPPAPVPRLVIEDSAPSVPKAPTRPTDRFLSIRLHHFHNLFGILDPTIVSESTTKVLRDLFNDTDFYTTDYKGWMTEVRQALAQVKDCLKSIKPEKEAIRVHIEEEIACILNPKSQSLDPEIDLSQFFTKAIAPFQCRYPDKTFEFDIAPPTSQKTLRKPMVGETASSVMFYKFDAQTALVVLKNLITNACKYGGDTIHIHAEVVPGQDGGKDQLRFEVFDNGPLIDQTEQVERMLQGVRLEEDKPGSGFGLVACGKLLQDKYGSTNSRITYGDSLERQMKSFNFSVDVKVVEHQEYFKLNDDGDEPILVFINDCPLNRVMIMHNIIKPLSKHSTDSGVKFNFAILSDTSRADEFVAKYGIRIAGVYCDNQMTVSGSPTGEDLLDNLHNRLRPGSPRMLVTGSPEAARSKPTSSNPMFNVVNVMDHQSIISSCRAATGMSK